MMKSMEISSQSPPSFYSDKSYEFHPYADLFPLMNNEGIKNHGLSIKKNGQHQDIILLDDLILDGRNTYLACHMFEITPRFQYYNNDLDPLTFVMVRNLHRRHLRSAQKAEIALELLKIEKRKAKERQIPSLFGNSKKDKVQNTVVSHGITTDQNKKKGKSIDIVAKELKMSSKTINKANKIKKVAKMNPEIHEQWEMAKRNEISLEEVYKKTEKLNDIKKGIVDTFVKTGNSMIGKNTKEFLTLEIVTT